MKFVGTSRRVLLARNRRLDVSTRGSSRSSTSLVCKINVRKHHLLARYTLTANKLHSFLCWRSASNFLKANIANFNFRGRLKQNQQTKKRTKEIDISICNLFYLFFFPLTSKFVYIFVMFIITLFEHWLFGQ